MEKVPFERVLGKAIGGRMQVIYFRKKKTKTKEIKLNFYLFIAKSLHESKGVVFHMERIVKKIVDNGNGAVAVKHISYFKQRFFKI